MISAGLLILAAICNSIMDTCSHHFSTSIFSKLNPKYWNAEISWKNKYNNGDPIQGRRRFLGIIIPVFFTDSWHFLKSLTIVLMVLAIVLYVPIINIWLDFVIYGILWNLAFNLFYNHLLIKK